MTARVERLLKSDFARNGLLVFVATMSANVLGYAFHFAISRKVGVEQYGVLAALNAAYMLGLVVSSIIGTIVIKYAAEFRATGDQEHLAALVRNLSLYGSIAGAIFIVLGFLFAPAAAAFLKIQNVTAIALCVSIIALSNVVQPIRSVFNGTEDFVQFAISSVMESALKAALGIGLAYAGYGVAGAFAGWAMGSAITLVYTMGFLLLRYRNVPARALNIDMRRLWKTMAGVSTAMVLLTSIGYVDVIVVKHFADATTAGLYGALSLSGKILFFFVGFVPVVLLPKASSAVAEGKSPVRFLVVALVMTLAFAGLGLVGYYFFPRLIITALAGDSFAAGAPFVFSYGIAMVLLAALNTVVYFKIGIHRFDFVLPLGVCAIGEFAGISILHSSLSQIIAVLIAGNAVALATSCYRIAAPGASLAVVRSEAA